MVSTSFSAAGGINQGSNGKMVRSRIYEIFWAKKHLKEAKFPGKKGWTDFKLKLVEQIFLINPSFSRRHEAGGRHKRSKEFKSGQKFRNL